MFYLICQSTPIGYARLRYPTRDWEVLAARQWHAYHLARLQPLVFCVIGDLGRLFYLASKHHHQGPGSALCFQHYEPLRLDYKVTRERQPCPCDAKDLV